MYIGRNTENDIFKFENVCIDNKFTFDSHIKITGWKAGQKLIAFSGILLYFETNKKELVFKSMVKSQFSYCPLVWMFCS